jgi:hypothetical protein
VTSCPPEIAKHLLEILRTGLLGIRMAGWNNEPQACARQADHLHNIPSLIANYSEQELLHYWECMRQEITPNERVAFTGPWSELERIIGQLTKAQETKEVAGTT